MLYRCRVRIAAQLIEHRRYRYGADPHGGSSPATKGERIGRVHSLSGTSGSESGVHMVVERKIFFYRTGWLYVPVSAIALLRHGKVILYASPTKVQKEAWQRRV